MRLCAVSFKECWQGADGTWRSDGGFPLQMTAIASLFDEATLVVTRGAPRDGGLPLSGLRVMTLDAPRGSDLRRKLHVLRRAPYYLRQIGRGMAGADVVHTPLPGDLPLLAMLLALARGKRVVARYGGSWAANGTTSLANRLTRSLMRFFGRRSHVMLAAGEGIRDAGIESIFSTALSRDELSAIPADCERGLSDPPRLVTIGRLSPEKGQRVLLEALDELRSAGVRPHLTFVGDGPDRTALELIVCQRGLAGQVRFAGQCDRGALSRECAEADLCVQPSLTEGFSKAWLDAMAHGLPVVASDVGAAASVLGAAGERGWLVPPGDAHALAKRLASVLKGGRDWPTLRRRCRRFTEGRTLEAWAERIGEICARRWGLRLSGGKLRA